MFFVEYFSGSWVLDYFKFNKECVYWGRFLLLNKIKIGMLEIFKGYVIKIF